MQEGEAAMKGFPRFLVVLLIFALGMFAGGLFAVYLAEQSLR
jgi:hypothetical protein